MEQTKNETKIENKTESKPENKTAPGNDKPKKERKPLTEAQRLKRQKMIVLPAMVLVFIGAMWLIFAPSSGKEQEPGTSGYNIEMPDADKENRRIIGDKAKAYEQGAMEERQENRSRAMQQLGDLFDRETAAADGDSDFDLANPGGTEEAVKPAPKTIQSSAAAYRDLNATLGNFYEQPKNDNAEMDELLERTATQEFLELRIAVVRQRIALEADGFCVLSDEHFRRAQEQPRRLLDELVERCLLARLLRVAAVRHEKRFLRRDDEHRVIAAEAAEIMEIHFLRDDEGVELMLGHQGTERREAFGNSGKKHRKHLLGACAHRRFETAC